MFTKILIANRGEIAARIIRTARSMGIATVAVHSDADAGAPHVRLADEAIRIGPAPSAQSYLRIEAILDAARATGAQAIHPGYGFLSENADFATACAQAGIVFIGPNLEAIRVMGSKALSKDLMARSGVPLSPGYQGEDQSPDTFRREAARIGYPVLLKATAGGGGKGMRLVEREADLEPALDSARREAKSAFGDDRFLVEKFIANPRHVEVQVFGDTHGNLVHIFERDCSVQRRHQKVIEEAPAPDLPPAVRARLHEAALGAARAVSYVGAGTVEFLYDARAGEVYFMEMNTRLQVEHPVTEMVTGLDLVAWQIRVAAGEPLPLAQDAIACTGHAVEARLYAEDPDTGFLPSTGPVRALHTPALSPGQRLDMGVEAGGEVTPFYDPMIGKLIAHGADRAEALSRLSRLVSEVRVAGPRTNSAFLHALLTHPAFQSRELDTGFIARHEADLIPHAPLPPEALAAAALAVRAHVSQPGATDPFDTLTGFRLNAPAAMPLTLRHGEDTLPLRLETSRHTARLIIPDATLTLTAIDISLPRLRFTLEGTPVLAHAHTDGQHIAVWLGARRHDLLWQRPDPAGEGAEPASAALSAPMPGVVSATPARAGAPVKKGEVLLILEAMKMEHPILAPADGTLTAHRFRPGDQVQQGDLLVEFTATEA
jgi:3-methylcrotonyl-CoA carboxylase alpha subunit